MQAGDVKLGKVFANDHQSVIPIQLRTLWLAGIALRAWPKPKAYVD